MKETLIGAVFNAKGVELVVEDAAGEEVEASVSPAVDQVKLRLQQLVKIKNTVNERCEKEWATLTAKSQTLEEIEAEILSYIECVKQFSAPDYHNGEYILSNGKRVAVMEQTDFDRFVFSSIDAFVESPLTYNAMWRLNRKVIQSSSALFITGVNSMVTGRLIGSSRQ